MSTETREQFEKYGFVIIKNDNQHDLSRLQHFIFEKIKTAIRPYNPSVDELLTFTSLENYHKLSFGFDHENFWTKNIRLFNFSDVNFFITQLSFFRLISAHFGDIDIADIEGLGYPEIYWRVVRPGGADVALAHKDSWFWELTNNIPITAQKSLAKVWIPIFSVVGKNALEVAPESQNIHVPYRGVKRHGRVKPEPDLDALRKVKFVAPNIPNGSMIIFDRNLLHRGASQAVDKTRYSLEFAIRSKCGRFQ